MAPEAAPVAGPGGNVAGVLLAGGLSRRMGGGDKCLRPLGGRPILARIAERLAPQAACMVINANGDPARFAAFGLPVAADVVDGFAGPLAGVLTGLEWVGAHAPACHWIATVATDTPFMPFDLVARLAEAVRAAGADLSCATSGGREHPVFGLWPVRLADDLRQAVVAEGMRKVDAWTARYALARADFPVDPLDPFFNVNRPDDMAAAEAILAQRREA
ncbi:MAG: molybdenum cofactor guanylyltransferase MobA [Rhodospirillales bacterium]